MAHFAEINPGTNTVINVIVVRDAKLLDENGQESESVGLQFLRDTVENGEDRTWVQTSYNNNFRTRYAAADDCYYDSDHDAFVLSEGRYFPSWTFDDVNKLWIPPIPKPEVTQQMLQQNGEWYWDEDLYTKDENDPKVRGWVARVDLDTGYTPSESE